MKADKGGERDAGIHIRGRGYRDAQKAASVREQRVGNPACGSGFPAKMLRVRTPDHDRAQAGGKKYKRFAQKGLKQTLEYASISNCDTLNPCCKERPDTARISLLPRIKAEAKRPEGGAKTT